MKGQFSVEYLLIVAFALVIIVPVVIFAYSSFTESQEEVAATSINQMGYQIVNTAKNVYFLGEFSKVTLEVVFPDGLDNFTVETSPGGDALVVVYQNSEIAFPSDVPLTHTFDSSLLNPGVKNVKLEYVGGAVNISVE